jgi:hypothetical protein
MQRDCGLASMREHHGRVTASVAAGNTQDATAKPARTKSFRVLARDNDGLG